MDEIEQEDPKAAWSIRGVSVAVRKLAIGYAKQRDIPVGALMEEIIEAYVRTRKGDRIEPPGMPSAPPASLPTMGALREIAEAAHLLATAKAAGAPEKFTAGAFAALNANLRAARGMAPLATRARPKEIAACLTPNRPKLDKPSNMANAAPHGVNDGVSR